jgi:hypothetical protein
VVAILLAWFILEKTRIISPFVAIGLVLLTGALAIWLLPYFTRVIPERQASLSAGDEDKGNLQGAAGGAEAVACAPTVFVRHRPGGVRLRRFRLLLKTCTQRRSE